MSKNVALIPARAGSKRLPKKNLADFGGYALIEWAIIRCKQANCFDEIYVNSDSEEYSQFAQAHNVKFYHRRPELGGDEATSEDFVHDFLVNIDCENVYQVHSITPLLSQTEIAEFVIYCEKNPQYQTVLSCIHDQIEVAFQGAPVNFTYNEKTNSQQLQPVSRLTWAISKWSKEHFVGARESGSIGTYCGEVGFFPVSALSGIPIKTQGDLDLVNAIRHATEKTS